MGNQTTSLITHLSWGHIEVTIEGKLHRYKDCKIWPGGAKEWNWTVTGTNHEPGIQPSDIEEILGHNVEMVILSRGMFNRLQVCPETERILDQRRIVYHIEETSHAVELYNDLTRQGKRVGGVFHSTC